MESLVEIRNNQVVVSSRQVAEKFGKRHDHVLRDIENTIKRIPNFEDTPSMFRKTTYKHEQNGQSYPEYLMNRDGFTLLAMGFTGKDALQWKMKYIAAFNEMEARLKNNTLMLPDFTNPAEAARAWAKEFEQRQQAEQQLEAAKPKVIFADAVSASNDTILIGELAKLLKQNGVNIGEKRLFEWLRNNGYLIKRHGDDRNMPTQRAMEMGLFRIKKTAITKSDGTPLTARTPKVTGKGQQYFVNKFLEGERK